MFKRTVLASTALLMTAAPALAWVPKLEETSAKAVIDAAYGRSTLPLPTFLTSDLSVKDGAFVAGKDALKVFDGGEQCLSDWLASPAGGPRGSRPLSLTLSGQADQLSFQGQQARDSFKSLTAQDALKDTTRLADGQLRLDLVVQGLPSEKQRGAYLLRLRGPDGKLLAPVRFTYVNDWKPMTPAPVTPGGPTPATASTVTPTPAAPASGAAATSTPAAPAGPFTGTLVYYFEPLKAGINANDKVDILIRTEAEGNCAYAVPMDLGKFY